MSQSITATRWPWAARAAARLTVTDDLPTPPLPEATASTRVEESSPQKEIFFCWAAWGPRRRVTIAWRCSSVITPRSTSTPVTPGSGETAAVTSLVIRSRRGQPATVSSTETVTSPSSTVTSLTMSSSVIGLWISGSITCPRAARTSSRVTMDSPRCGRRRRRQALRAKPPYAGSVACPCGSEQEGEVDVRLRRDRLRRRPQRAGRRHPPGRGGLVGLPAGGERRAGRGRPHGRVHPARLSARLRGRLLPAGRRGPVDRRSRPQPVRPAVPARPAAGGPPVCRQPGDRPRALGGRDGRLDRQGPPRRRVGLDRPRRAGGGGDGAVPAGADAALAVRGAGQGGRPAGARRAAGVRPY